MRFAYIALAALSLASCAQVTDTSTSDFDPSKIAYFRDARTDICFAVITYQRFDTGGKLSYGISQAAVACDPKVLALVKK